MGHFSVEWVYGRWPHPSYNTAQGHIITLKTAFKWNCSFVTTNTEKVSFSLTTLVKMELAIGKLKKCGPCNKHQEPIGFHWLHSFYKIALLQLVAYA